MTFYHLHYTELRINLMKHRHRISSFAVFIVRNKKHVVNVFAYKNNFYLKSIVTVQSPLSSPGSLFLPAACPHHYHRDAFQRSLQKYSVVSPSKQILLSLISNPLEVVY